MSKEASSQGPRPDETTDGLDRRKFLLAGLAMAATPLLATPTDAEPILDIHQHIHYQGRSNEQLIAHQQYHGVAITNLLPGEGWMLSALGGNADCKVFQAEHSDKFVRFACADPVEARMLDIGGSALEGPVDNLSARRPSPLGLSWPPADVKLRAWGLAAGGRNSAIGIGELKFHVPLASPEMDRIYKLAEELNVPVLLHIEHLKYNLGIENLEKVLQRYPKVNFIGHAQTWWGNISADLDPLDYYPKGPVKSGGLTDRLLSDYPNIYGDLSADSGLNAVTRDPDFARGFLDRHYRKLIWGSDCDCRDGKGGGRQSGYCIAGRDLSALQNLVSDRAKLRRILYENGAALLRLKQA